MEEAGRSSPLSVSLEHGNTPYGLFLSTFAADRLRVEAEYWKWLLELISDGADEIALFPSFFSLPEQHKLSHPLPDRSHHACEIGWSIRSLIGCLRCKRLNLLSYISGARNYDRRLCYALDLYARYSVYLTEGGNMAVDIISMVKVESTIDAVPGEVGRLLLFGLSHHRCGSF